jgi:hypothetical protein
LAVDLIRKRNYSDLSAKLWNRSVLSEHALCYFVQRLSCPAGSSLKKRMAHIAVLLTHRAPLVLLHQSIPCCLDTFSCQNKDSDILVFYLASAVMQYIILRRKGNDKFFSSTFLFRLRAQYSAILFEGTKLRIFHSSFPSVSGAAFPMQIVVWAHCGDRRNESRRNSRCVCALYTQAIKHHHRCIRIMDLNTVAHLSQSLLLGMLHKPLHRADQGQQYLAFWTESNQGAASIRPGCTWIGSRHFGYAQIAAGQKDILHARSHDIV